MIVIIIDDGDASKPRFGKISHCPGTCSVRRTGDRELTTYVAGLNRLVRIDGSTHKGGSQI